jgi:hypothetical protein
MSHPLDDIRAASLPASALEVLADLRGESGISILESGDRAWVRWESAEDAALDRLLAVEGLALFDRRGGLWYPHGSRLPAVGTPLDTSGFFPIARAITPLPARPTMPGAAWPDPARLAIVLDGIPRDATALRCTLDELAEWAEMATTARIGSLSAARAGSTLLIVGKELPPIAGGDRYWGDRVLVPLGFRPEPCLRESALLAALDVPGDHRLVIGADGCEAVPLDAFRPLSRASLRLAREEAAP